MAITVTEIPDFARKAAGVSGEIIESLIANPGKAVSFELEPTRDANTLRKNIRSGLVARKILHTNLYKSRVINGALVSWLEPKTPETPETPTARGELVPRHQVGGLLPTGSV